VNEWLRHQERLRGGSTRTTTKPVAVTRTVPPQPVPHSTMGKEGWHGTMPTPVAADNEQYHQHINRPADLSITALAAAITKVLNGAVAPVVIQPATGIGTDSDGIGVFDDGE